jgi:hypothetical protein
MTYSAKACLLPDYGDDTARDVARILISRASFILFFWPLDKTKNIALKG